MTLQHHQPSILLLTQDTFTAGTLPKEFLHRHFAPKIMPIGAKRELPCVVPAWFAVPVATHFQRLSPTMPCTTPIGTFASSRFGPCSMCSSTIAASDSGAVDMIESGITIGDSFDIGSLQRPASTTAKKSFAPPQRVYIDALGVAVESDIATKLMSSPRGKVQFACKDKGCCPNGFESMLGDMERLSTLARQRQYTELSRIPVSMRAEHFIHNVFSPVCDMLTRASDVHELFKKTQRRMLSVKAVLLDLHRERVRIQERSRVPGNDSSRPTTARVIPLTPREPRGR